MFRKMFQYENYTIKYPKSQQLPDDDFSDFCLNFVYRQHRTILMAEL